MRIMLITVCVLVSLVVLIVGSQLWNHSQLRRGVLFDRQDLLHSADVFHVVSALKLKPGQELLEGVGRYVKGVEQQGAEVIYAGKVAFPKPRKSRQMPDLEWEAFVVSQYATRDAWETAVVSTNYTGLKNEFTRVWSLGMQRKAGLNFVVLLYMLQRRVRHILSGNAATYPFEPVEVPAERSLQVTAQRELLDEIVAENEAFSEDALVIINFQKFGDARQRSANSKYGDSMMSMLSEVGHGPVHIGRAISLEDDVDFDQVAIVSYPGIKYFAEMVQSKFYTSIFGGKQLGDDLSAPTVPILQHL
ncbi:MAG: hypothetical protein CMQ11_13575 [Gammaproteobacteria bacterium]|nr:hypothetical protein [Gammaproteobacteria bacterium]